MTELEQTFDAVTEPEAVAWEAITRVTVVCLVEDPDAPDGALLVLHERDERWVVPSEARRPDEDVWDDTVLRIPLAAMGFRRQETHPFAIDHDRRHVVFWVFGGRYAGERLQSVDVPWWTGSVAEGAVLLAEQGDGALATLVTMRS